MKQSRILGPVAYLLLVGAVTTALAIPTPRTAMGQAASPSATYSCDTVTAGAAGTPTMDDGMTGTLAMASPASDMDMAIGIDLIYIDMMIPHHASIIAMAEAALPHLTDERLHELARTIMDTQGAEITELRGLREDLSGSTMPMPMDDAYMGAMMELMPGMDSMDEMAMQMDQVALVTAFCAADDRDLAFIDLTIPHHEMAITASEAVREQSSNDQVRTFAERVIADQQAEVDLLTDIREEIE